MARTVGQVLLGGVQVEGVGRLALHDLRGVVPGLGLPDDLEVLGRLRRRRRSLGQAGGQGRELAVADLAAVTGDDVGVLGPQRRRPGHPGAGNRRPAAGPASGRR